MPALSDCLASEPARRRVLRTSPESASASVRSPQKSTQKSSRKSPRKLPGKSPANFDYDGLTDAVRRDVQDRTAAIRALLDSRLVMRTGEDVVQVGTRLQIVRDEVAPQAFCAWVAAEFGWKQPHASRLICAARVFQDVDCVDHFQPGALYVLARGDVPAAARAEAIALAGAGDFIEKKDADALVDRHTGGWAATKAWRKVCNATHKAMKKIGPLPNAQTLAAAHRLNRRLGIFLQRCQAEKDLNEKSAGNSDAEKEFGTNGKLIPQEYSPTRLLSEIS